MSVQTALSFLRKARRSEDLRRELDALDGEASVEALVALGERAGFRFTAEELDRAHTHDWRMRWARYRH